MDPVPTTVVETPRFIRQAEGLLSEQERLELIEHLARNPKAGVVIPDTGGVRKLRWPVGGKGKSGGARVIYFHHDESFPTFLLAMFAKNVKVDLTQEERNAIKRLVPALVQSYQERKAR